MQGSNKMLGMQAGLFCFTLDVNENSLSSPPVLPERWDGEVVHFCQCFGLKHIQKTFFPRLVADALLATQSPKTEQCYEKSGSQDLEPGVRSRALG